MSNRASSLSRAASSIATLLCARESRRSTRGFTLIELLVTIAMASILMAVAIPSYSALMTRLRLSSQSNDLSSSLAFARSEAMRRGLRMTVCKAASATACATSGSWSNGWLVFVDNRHLTGNVAGVVDGSGAGTDEILRVVPSLVGATVTASSSFDNWVGFRPDGISVGSGGAANGSLTLCTGSGGMALTVNALGRTQTSKVSC